ncbi:MAG: DUF350 domain-containing protein [Candidatus Latescibacteria bacterium]|nr:DUF350 domain-containing protein [Candidatus Latescibacterota bacterium]
MLGELSKVFLLNIGYAIVGVLIGIIAAFISYRFFDHITHFHIAMELENRNVAVGIVVGCIFIMIGIMVGLIIGLSLN